MKRKNINKIMSVALATTMVAGLCACGSANNSAPASADNSSSTPAATKSEATTEATQAPKERQTITWSTIDLNAGVNATGEYSEQIMQQIQDFADVNIDLTWVANDALSEKNSLYLANPKTMPNIITWGGTVTGDVVSAANNGAFVDLNQYIWDSNKYPNLSQMSKDVAANLTVNGQLIAVPRTRVVGRYGLSYREDWAKKLGVELPKNATPDDVYKMLYAFTYNDPDGNGKDDTIGMEMTSYTGVFDIIQTWFGCGNGWADVNGELVPVFMQPEYMEAVDYIKKIYDDGLMPKDWASRPTDSWSNGCKTGENGVYIDVLDSGKRIWQYFEAEDTLTPSVVDESVPATMVLYGAVNGHTLATAGYNGFFTLSATTLDTDAKVEAALTLLDKLCEPEMLILTQYGIEGVNYEMKDGYIVDLDLENETLANNYKGLNQLLTFLPSSEASDAAIPVERTKFNQAQNDAYAAALPYAEINPALSYLVNSETYSSDGAALNDKINAARSQYICGEIDKAGLEAAIADWKAQGGDQIISEVNAQYKANK